MDLLDLTYTSDGFVMNPGISSPIMGLDPASGLAGRDAKEQKHTNVYCRFDLHLGFI